MNTQIKILTTWMLLVIPAVTINTISEKISPPTYNKHVASV